MKKRGKKKRRLHKRGKKLMQTVLLLSISLILLFMVLLKKDIVAVNTTADISLEDYVEVELKIINKNTILLFNGCSAIPIIISQYQTESIFFGINKINMFRPGTHDLVATLLNSMNIDIKFVRIVSLENNTFFADLTLKHENTYYIIDARPSDAIAIAVRNNVKVYIKKDLLMYNPINICSKPIAATLEEMVF